MSTSVDTQGWSRERLDSAIRRRMNAAQQLASNPEADQQELAKVNEELDSLFAARRAPTDEKKQDEPTRVVVEGVEYVVPDKFTMGEVADIEEVTGGDVGSGKANLRMMVAMVWITLRRKDPSWTLERVRQLDMDALVEKVADASPPGGA